MHWQYHLKVPNSVDNWTIRQYLSNYLLIPKHLIYQLRKNYRVLVNKKYIPMNFKIHKNDKIQLTFIPNDFKHPFPRIIPDSAKNVQPIFETNDVIIINKIRGDKTHPNQPKETGTTLNHVAAYLASNHQLPYIIHRLDQQTSGALILAKNPAVVPILVRLIADKNIKRSYLTWVNGTNLRPSGVINKSIGFDPNDKRKRKINGTNAKQAITYYQVIKEQNNCSLLKVKLQTGRTHQIRIHLAYLNHPIIGDPLYNSDTLNHEPMLLHSYKVKFIEPMTNQIKEVFAPIPKEFKQFNK